MTYPFVAARWFTPAQGRTIRVIVIHDAEFPEKERAAYGIADYFRTTDTKASAHFCVDNNNIVQCVHEHDVAWAAPGCNKDGLQIEMAGYAKQTPSEWRDVYSNGVIDNTARLCADLCTRHDIPAVLLTNEQLKAGANGIITHAQASAVYHLSDHSDPGPNFPLAFFLECVQAHMAA